MRFLYFSLFFNLIFYLTLKSNRTKPHKWVSESKFPPNKLKFQDILKFRINLIHNWKFWLKSLRLGLTFIYFFNSLFSLWQKETDFFFLFLLQHKYAKTDALEQMIADYYWFYATYLNYCYCEIGGNLKLTLKLIQIKLKMNSFYSWKLKWNFQCGSGKWLKLN